MKKRILGLLLALCLVVGLLPATAMAAETTMWPYFVFQKADGTAMYKAWSSPSAEPVYFKTVDGRVTEDGASATDYNIMFSWAEGGNPTLTLKGAVINNDKMHGINFGRGSNYPNYLTSTLDIVVVADSSITVSGGTGYGAIHSYSKGDLTVKSENNAKLTLTDGKSGVTNGMISSAGNLTLDGLNVKFTTTYSSICAGIVCGKNVTIKDCTISAQAGGIHANENLLIKNSEVSMQLSRAGHHFVNATGTITLEESAVTIGHKTSSGGNKIFSKLPVLVYSSGAEVIRATGTAAAPVWNADYTFSAPNTDISGYVTADFAAGSTYTEDVATTNFFSITPKPPHVHTPAADDGDCTTAVKCTVCNEVVTPAAAAHVAGADDGDCTTAVKCTNTGCTKDAVEAKASHADNRTDCSVAGTCTVCGTAIPAGSHASSGNNVATCKAKAKCDLCGKEYGELAACKPAADDGDCTTAVKCTVCNEVVTAAKEHKYTNNTDTSCDNTGCTHTRKVEAPSNKPNTNSPQTGDEFNMVLWVSLLAVSVVGFVAVLVFGKKRAAK